MASWLGGRQGIHNPARACLPELPAGRAALLLKGKVMDPCQHQGGLCKPSVRQGGVPSMDFVTWICLDNGAEMMLSKNKATPARLERLQQLLCFWLCQTCLCCCGGPRGTRNARHSPCHRDSPRTAFLGVPRRAQCFGTGHISSGSGDLRLAIPELSSWYTADLSEAFSSMAPCTPLPRAPPEFPQAG